MLTVFLSSSSVSEHVNSLRQSVTCFLDLDIGLSKKSLTITLDHCPSQSHIEICNFLDQATESLD